MAETKKQWAGTREAWVQRLWPLVEPWFGENYGRHLLGRFLDRTSDVSTALDVGAGTGCDLDIVRRRFPDAALHAVEVFPPYIAALRERGVHVATADIEEAMLPFASESMDLLIANQVLEHVKDIFFVLHEFARVLKCGGTMIVGVPNLAAWHNRALLLLGIQPTAISSLSPHVRGFTRGDLIRLITVGSGGALQIADARSAGFYPFPPRVARIMAALLPGLGWSVHLHVRKVAGYEDAFLQAARQFPETNFRTSPPTPVGQGL